ncbi:MAG: radical SAM family heme chaperone HemW [Anaerolineae bacterium]|nr:radical SAM family heme chaperone HemW [Anaerolineae bacterium]
MLALYLHIPWCVTRCIYCDFNTYVGGEDTLKARYHVALQREIREAGAALGHPPLDTIFFGGGTPTTLPPGQLVELVETVKAAFALRPDAEVTVEANPGTLSLVDLRELRQGGVNRLSLGVQSFNNDELRFLSRLHDADAARRAVEQARAAGFDNLSLDLIFNLPQQTLAQWQFNLQEALRLLPDHLSLYSLIVEPGTRLHRQVDEGHIPAPDDDVAADMYASAIDTLAGAGYVHYEISNWARGNGETDWQTPRLASAHNLIYWRNQPYLGLGAGAFGTVNGERWMNVKRPQDYIRRIERGKRRLGAARDEKTYEQIDRDTAMSEHMLLGLRLVREGVSAAEFSACFNILLQERYNEAINRGLERDLLEWIEPPTGLRLRLTRQGRFLANRVMVEFMA